MMLESCPSNAAIQEYSDEGEVWRTLEPFGNFNLAKPVIYIDGVPFHSQYECKR